MTFRTFGRTLLLLAGSAGLSLGLTSCANDHTVGYIYVVGTTNNGQPGGQISEFREDNNNGVLTPVAGSPVTSGGLNPVRMVTVANRFVYVLNQGTPNTNANGAVTGAYTSSAIQLFSIGGYGQLTPQLQYASQGFGSERLLVDSSGSHLWVLDQYSNVGAAGGTVAPVSHVGATSSYPCQDPKDPTIFHPVGSITLFTIDGSTGRLSLQQNQQIQTLTYFPVGCNPVDFRQAGQYLFTMDAGSATNNDVQTVNVYAIAAATGQLTTTQTAVQRITSNNSSNIVAITGDGAGRYVYLLDGTSDLIYLYTVGTSGALIPINGSPYDNSTNNGNTSGAAAGTEPVQTLTDSTGKYVYVINSGPATGTVNAFSSLGGYDVDQSNGYFDSVSRGSPYPGIVSGPVCILEDPTNQYIYVAGSLDNSITGRKIDPGTGDLKPLNKAGTFPTVGTPSWCVAISSAF